MTPLADICWHELTHVRVAQHFGVGVVRVEVSADGRGVTLLEEPAAWDAEQLHRRAVINAVGVSYERWRGRSAHDTQDTHAALTYAAGHHEQTGQYRSPFLEADMLFNSVVFGDEFNLLAAALELRRTLTGAEIEALTRRAATTNERAQQAAAERAMATHRRLTQPPRLVVNEYGRWLYPADTSGG